MNSFSFLIAFVALCALPISYGFPHGLDCGNDHASPLMPGQILAPGQLFHSGHITSAPAVYAGNHGHDGASHDGSVDGGDWTHGDWARGDWGHGVSGDLHGASVHTSALDGAHSGVTSYDDSLGSSHVSSLNDGGHWQPAAEPCEEPPKVLIHQQRHPIIVNRPATNVVVGEPAVIVKAKPVLIKRPPGVVVHPVIKHVQPKPVKVQPVFVRVIKPVEKHFVKKTYADDCAGPVWSHTKVVADNHY